MRNLVPLQNTVRSLTGLVSIVSLMVSTSALAFPVSPPATLEAIRPADGATIPTTPDIWVAFSSNAGSGITGTFVDEGGAVVANAIVVERSLPFADFDFWSVSADAALTAGSTVELVLQIPFGQLDEQRFLYVVEQTPRAEVVLPTPEVSEVGVYLSDFGQIFVEFTVAVAQQDVPDDVQAFTVGQLVDIGPSSGVDRLRTASHLIPHPALGQRQEVRTTLSETLRDDEPTEVCVSLGAYTVSDVELPVTFVPTDMDCFPIDLAEGRWDALIAKREADRILLSAEPDPLPQPGLYFGCSQSGATSAVPLALLGLLCFGFARRRRRG